MLRNYLKTAARHLRRNPGYTAINVAGLSIGIAACLIIGLYIRDQLSYDRFQANADRVVRVALDVTVPDGVFQTARSSPPMARALKEDFPEVVETARIRRNGSTLLSSGDRRNYEERFFFADSTLFDVLGVRLEAGSPSSALTDPFTVVLSREAARRYFGNDDPLGKTLRFDREHDLVVTGVLADSPGPSHFRPDFVASFTSFNALRPSQTDNWGSTSVNTYLLLRSSESASTLAARLPDFLKRHVAADWVESWQLVLQPLSSIHLHSHRSGEVDTNGNIRSSYFLGTIGLFVLLIACFNFVNLSMARSSRRAPEVGIRKALGAHGRHVTYQFLGEALMLSAIALVLAFVLATLALPAFNSLSGSAIRFNPAHDGIFVLWATAFALFTGMASGLYPSLRLARFAPVASLRGRVARGPMGFSLRRTLVVVQFVISIVLIVGTLTVSRQLNYLDQADLGFDEQQVAVIPMQRASTRERYGFVKEQLLSDPRIVSVSASSDVPGKGFDQIVHVPEGFTNEDAPAVPIMFVDADFVSTLGIELAQGRNFRSDAETDAYIVNEAAARRFGWDAPIGKRIADGQGESAGRVIGVARDFHFESLRADIEPMFLRVSPDWFEKVIIRVRPGETAGAVETAQRLWQRLEPDYPFQMTFLDEDFGRMYEADRRVGRILGLASTVAILIACLGLFGLAAYTTQMRTKEIGIRKVLGASAAGIVALLAREYVRIALAAFVIAVPIAWYAMDAWLSGFEFRIQLGPVVFLLAGVLVVAIAFATVFWQALAAATADPVASLRYE